MRLRVFILLLISCCQAFGQPNTCNRIISGQVLDRTTEEPLPYATVTLTGTERGSVTDLNGFFEIDNICEEEVHLEVRFIGYKTLIHHHDFHHSSPTVYLAPDETLLESLVIEDERSPELKSLSIQRKEINSLMLVTSSIGDLTNQLTGVSLLKTGTNISKPMIHGLHSNRVLVINQGVRHAYQVWGQEHAPEIEPSHVDQIEIVKGAGTVKYGPDALGGVILYDSKKPNFDEKINGSLSSSYQTNGRAINSQMALGQGSHRFAWNIGGFSTYQGDLKAPDYNLTNTGKRELGASFNTFLHQPKFDFQISGSYFEQELGILRGSLVGNLTDLQNAIDRSIPNPTNSFTYKLQNPKQETEHGLLKTDLSVFLGEHSFDLQYAIQRNVRREYDVRRGELNDRPVIDLELYSHTIDAEWIQPSKGQWSGNSGIQLFTQNSVNEPGSNPVNFVPDYDVLNIGAFSIQSYTFDEATLELGARLDYQSLAVKDTIREVTIYSNRVDYFNATFTLGVRKQLTEHLSMFSNLGSAWRPPNVAELYSFGYHHSRFQFGLWRYELNPISTSNILSDTDKPVPSEKSLKWVTGVELEKNKVTAEFIFYANHINNYLFLRPYGITVNIAGTFPYFLYDQTNVLFVGSDWDILFDHSKSFTSELKVSYVYATERENRQALLEIPPLNINYALNWKNDHWSSGLNLNYTARQWNKPAVIEPASFQNSSDEINLDEIFDFMPPSGDYLLLGGNITYKTKQWNISVTADNLLNSSYRVYTDRLRYFSDAPGRNFIIALEYNF